MPVHSAGHYRPEPLLRNAHLNTILPAVARKVTDLDYRRERLTTPDGDFLDVDWVENGQDRLLIALHGLEGSSDRPYVRGILRCAREQGWDGLGLNFRGCSGEDNRQLRTYHMGETTDLHWIIEQALATGRYRYIGLAGFSLGGNVVMMYLSRDREKVPGAVVGGVAYSVPVHIPSANERINHWENVLYRYRFMKTLNAKLRQKAARFPEAFPDPLPNTASFLTFDNFFTAPVHGFRDAVHYWTASGALRYLNALCRPVLLINALDDTFLSQRCYPEDLAREHQRLHLMMPRWGGHIGFFNWRRRHLWSEVQGMAFLEEKSAPGCKTFVKQG